MRPVDIESEQKLALMKQQVCILAPMDRHRREVMTEIRRGALLMQPEIDRLNEGGFISDTSFYDDDYTEDNYLEDVKDFPMLVTSDGSGIELNAEMQVIEDLQNCLPLNTRALKESNAGSLQFQALDRGPVHKSLHSGHRTKEFYLRKGDEARLPSYSNDVWNILKEEGLKPDSMRTYWQLIVNHEVIQNWAFDTKAVLFSFKMTSMSPFDFKIMLECWAGHKELDEDDYIELAHIITYLIPIVRRTGTVDRDFILKMFDEFIYQTHDKALSKDARDTLLAEELKKPVCDRPLNQKGAQILNNVGFLLERAEKMRLAAEVIAERVVAAEQKASGASNVSHVKLFMSIVPMAFGFVVCPTKSTAPILHKTVGKTREFLFSLHSMRYSTEQDRLALRSTSSEMQKLMKLSTRLFPFTWKRLKAIKSLIPVIPVMRVVEWIKCKTCNNFRKLPIHVKLSYRSQNNWCCLSMKEAFNAPEFENCNEWLQEDGCPALLPLVAHLPIPLALGNREGPSIGSANQEPESENSDDDNDSLDGIFNEIRGDADSDDEGIYKERYNRAEAQHDYMDDDQNDGEYDDKELK